VLVALFTSACGRRVQEPSAEANAPLRAEPEPAAASALPAVPPSATPRVAEPVAALDGGGTTLRFAVIGDYGAAGVDERRVSELVKAYHPDIVITTGDNNYPFGAADTIDANIGQFYAEYIGSYHSKYGRGAAENRFFPSLGNHDWYTDDARAYLDYFTLPGNERYYDFAWGPVHFFMLDTDEREPDGAGADSIQARWLEQRLARSGAPWKLVFAHHAPYSSGRVPDFQHMRWPFKAWGADAVLSGYYHVYERLLVDGLPYFVNGLGGAFISGFGETDENSRFRYDENNGALRVDAGNGQITFRFVNRDGRVVDEYILRKNRS